MDSGATSHPVQEQVYKSVLHPGHRSISVLFGSEIVRPLAACMLPVMLGALNYMLTGRDPLRFLTIGFPFAMVIASGWTIFQLRRRVAEVMIRGEAVRILSAWQVAAGHGEDWVSLLDVRREPSGLVVTLGHDSRHLLVADWPNLSRMETVLRAASDAFIGRVQSGLSS
ncbi:MAG: hypothetical protein ACI9W4_002401 [Rhodothermales bacterium]|jgi:hypothetical protein